MTDRVAVTLTTTGQLLRWVNKSSDPTFDPATETETAITAQPPAMEPDTVKYFKVAGGLVVPMDQAEKDVVDAAEKTKDEAGAIGAVPIGIIYAALADLPLPPPAPCLLVCVTDTGGGVPGFAISGATTWDVFVRDKVVP